MLEFNIVTLFPELFEGFTRTSLIGKAIEKELLRFSFVDLREFTSDRHRTVDDTPYGGGAGMVMKATPIRDAFASLPECHKILMTPQGKPFTQSHAAKLSKLDKPLLLFCGRYEGVDERVLPMFDEQVSIGDFVLNGGETAAMAVIEAVSRLVPGVIGKMESTLEESFSDGLLEYPHYTRPEDLEGARVPPILLSGNHGEIAKWRKGQALLRTYLQRPDLFEQYKMDKEERKLFDIALKGHNEK